MTDCLTTEEILHHNEHNGANNYIDPLTQMLCVRFNNSPLMGDYWIEKKSLENTDISEDFSVSPFRKAVEGQNQLKSSNIEK